MPFGKPVEPDVYRINSGSSAFITSASHAVEALSRRGCNHWSRPEFILISVLIRFATKTVLTPRQLSKASSTIPFKSIVFAPRYEPSLVNTILQSESLIRVDNAVEENPANTTE